MNERQLSWSRPPFTPSVIELNIHASRVRGHYIAKRALEVASVGDLGVILIGPCGSGKTALREAFPLVRSAEIRQCPCGYDDLVHACQCSERALTRWGRRLDRITADWDILVEVPPVSMREWTTPATDDNLITARITAALSWLGGRPIARLHTGDFTADSSSAGRAYEMVVRRLGLSYDRAHRMIRVARAIADLGQSADIEAKHIAEAVQYSNLNWIRGR